MGFLMLSCFKHARVGVLMLEEPVRWHQAWFMFIILLSLWKQESQNKNIRKITAACSSSLVCDDVLHCNCKRFWWWITRKCSDPITMQYSNEFVMMYGYSEMQTLPTNTMWSLHLWLKVITEFFHWKFFFLKELLSFRGQTKIKFRFQLHIVPFSLFKKKISRQNLIRKN